MAGNVLPSLICAAALIIGAITLLVVALRLLYKPSQRPSMAADSMPAAIVPASPAPRRPPSIPLPQLPARPQPRDNLPYVRIPHLLTAAEADFFAALLDATPANLIVFAQVRLASLVEVQQWARRDKTNWYKIQAKCVDFVLCEARTYAPRLVVELDDRSHDRPDRRERDAFVDSVLTSAGLPILHVRWQRRYDPGALSQQITGALGIGPQSTPTPLPIPAAVPAPSVSPPDSSPYALASAVTPSAMSMRRVCGQCQSELRDNARFCTQCGASFGVVASA
jgi:very-short-patch-repair endonuclease